jgi:O-antigen ligase
MLALANYQAWVPEAAVERVEMTRTEGAGGEVQVEESAASRIIIWQGAWEMIQQHPLGVGLQRFQSEIGRYSAIALDAHNYYLLVAAELGALALFALMALMVRMLWLAIQVIRQQRDTEQDVIGWSLLLATVALIMGNFYGSSFNFGELMCNYWALAGTAARLCFLGDPTQTLATGRGSEAKPAKAARGGLPRRKRQRDMPAEPSKSVRAFQSLERPPRRLK